MIDNLIITFFVFSFLGYIAEVVYCSVGNRRFVNRGFLYGPYLPIYGFGALIVTIFLDPLSAYPVLVFLLAFVLTSALEYFTSWLLEKFFSVKLWDYSKHKVNINGRVCLLNSTLFGLLGLAAEYLIQPHLHDLLAMIPVTIKHYAAILIAVVFASDTVLSITKMKAFQSSLAHIRALRSEAEEKFRTLQGEGKTELAEALRARIEEAIERYKAEGRKTARHIMLSNPTISSRNEAIQKQIILLNEWVRDRKALKKQYKDDLKAMDKERIEKIRNAGKND